jgi:aspartyl-tRNA(Asn)/glutamyl-tRNA(Gln) amidotransferase subunit C
MNITIEDINKIAKLARLGLSSEETATFANQMGNILSYVETLNELNTDGITPTSHAVPVENAFRPDVVYPSGIIDKSLTNAPESADNYFRVPPVIE